jgi:hypothetical protein
MRPKFDPRSLAGGIVYIKPVDVEDLPDEVREQAGDLRQIFAVHKADGEQLALVANRSMAFALALEHEMVPYAVH